MIDLGYMLRNEVLELDKKDAIKFIATLQKYELKALATYCIKNNTESEESAKVIDLLRKINLLHK